MVISAMVTPQECDVSLSERFTTADLEGNWVRTDRPRRGIARAFVEAAEGGLRIRLSSVDDTGLTDWGTVAVDAVYAASSEAKTGVAFTAMYSLPSTKVDLHANLSKGLLIIASMARFPDGRRGEFAREFFRKVEEHIAQ
jgi:hypothetical protein